VEFGDWIGDWALEIRQMGWGYVVMWLRGGWLGLELEGLFVSWDFFRLGYGIEELGVGIGFRGFRGFREFEGWV